MNPPNDTPDEHQNPAEEFEQILKDLLAGKGINGLPEGSGIDPAQFAAAAGLGADPGQLAGLFENLRQAMNKQTAGIDWHIAQRTASQIASASEEPINASDEQALQQALNIAALWLAEVSDIRDLAQQPVLLSRSQWVLDTAQTWTSLAEPVALSISAALTDALRENAPEALRDMLSGATSMIQNIGGALFATQLGQILGRLSQEVVSGGDVGIPLLNEHHGALLPQNIAAFVTDLEIPAAEVHLYLAVRELAHARLFRHAQWLRPHLISTITDYARGIHIDMSRLEHFAHDFDPSSPEALNNALVSGAFIPEKTDAQLRAHARLETLLALIEGWVDTVTAAATTRLPKSLAIAETVRRRRATGGPAESAFSTLIGLELRPRRLREAAALWSLVDQHAGASIRDGLWDHPDLLPSSEEIDQPELILTRLGLGAGQDETPSALDQALASILSGESSQAPVETDGGGIVPEAAGGEQEAEAAGGEQAGGAATDGQAGDAEDGSPR